MKIVLKALIGILFLPWLWGACSDTEESQNYDPTQPVEIKGFTPDTGGYRSDFIIEGSNFGIDLQQIKVFFNEKEAQLMNSKGNVIYCRVPKQPGEKSKITVQVGDQKTTLKGKEFVYEIRSNVSTLCGKAKEPGYQDGKVAESLFQDVRFIVIDNENNYFITEGVSRVRLVSKEKDKVMTLVPSTLFGQPVFSPDKKSIYYIGDGDRTVYRMDAETQWTLESIGRISQSDYFHCLIFANEDFNYMYTRRNTGEFLRIDMREYFEKGRKISPNNLKRLGHIGRTTGGQNGIMVWNPVDKKIYCTTHRDGIVWRITLNGDEDATIEEYTQGGSGYQDGDVADAKFSSPRGIAVDSEGNLHIADVANHCIRKIDIKSNTVSTVSGFSRKAGFKDGSLEEALFNSPWGLYLDSEDILYVAESGNNDVRRIAIE